MEETHNNDSEPKQSSTEIENQPPQDNQEPTTDPSETAFSEEAPTAEPAEDNAAEPPSITAEPNTSVAPADPPAETPVESTPPAKVVSDTTANHEDTSAAEATPQPVVTSLPREHRKVMRWLLPLLILILVGIGLYLVYHYGQTKNTPVQQTKKDIQLLQVGLAEPLPASIYPNVDDSAYTNDIDNQAFEGLTTFYDLSKVGPQLALSWTNPDASTWVFKLRPNVKFHTGHTMTATDVKASLDSMPGTILGDEFGSTIKEVSVVDPLTVKITTNGPDPILPNELTDLFIYDTTSKTPNSPVNGTGPYTLKPGTDIKNSIDLVAFNGYYGARPHVREIKFLSYDSTDAAIAAVNAGKVDIGEVSTKANVEKITNPRYTDVIIGNPLVAHLVPNTVNGSPFSKLAVRNAVAQALDPDAFLKARHIDGEPATQTIAPNIPGYDPTITRPKYDVTAAKKALADAGYPNGFSFTFTYYSSAQDMADEVKRQLALVGITVKEDPQTDLDVLGNKVQNGLTDMYYNSLGTSLADATDFIAPVVSADTFYNNPAISQLFAQSSQTLDPAKRLELLKQVSDKMVADRADFPLYVYGDIHYMIAKNIVVQPVRQGGDLGVTFAQTYGK